MPPTWTPLPSGVTIVTSPHRHVFVPGAETEGRHVATGAKEGTISGYSGASGGPGLGVSITGDGATVAGAMWLGAEKSPRPRLRSLRQARRFRRRFRVARALLRLPRWA